MSYDVRCDIILQRDGRDVLDPEAATVLKNVADLRNAELISKMMGVPRGDLAGTVDSINQRAGTPLVIWFGDEIELTDIGKEVLEIYAVRHRVLIEQMRYLWEKPWLTTDGVIIHEGKIILIRRKNPPFKGMYALPGGIVEYGERVEDCVVREIEEETGLRTEVIGIGGVFSDPDRDPRGHFITISFNLRAIGGSIRSGDDAAEVASFDLKIIRDSLERIGIGLPGCKGETI
jgi:8-oxo-dGTP diphosphatase